MTVERDWLYLGKYAMKGPLNPKSVVAIKQAVCEELGCTVEDLDGKGRHGPLVRARQVAYWIARRDMGPSRGSYPRLGELFGWRDHSTIMHGCKVISYMLQYDPWVIAMVGAVGQRLTHGAPSDGLTPVQRYKAWDKAYRWRTVPDLPLLGNAVERAGG